MQALPKMAEAAHHPKLKQAFKKHLTQTEGQVERLKKAFELLGEKAEPKPCKGMQGLIEEGGETIEENEDLDEIAADLAVIGFAQKSGALRDIRLRNGACAGAADRRARHCYALVSQLGRGREQ